MAGHTTDPVIDGKGNSNKKKSIFGSGATDTRCARPEYQLDVDVMMLEYTVYHAVQAKLEWLNTLVSQLAEHAEDGRNDDDDDIENKNSVKSSLDFEAEKLKEKAARLSVVSDCQISLFRLNHPSVSYTPGCEYNIKILQFLILLEHWISVSSRTQLGSGSNWMFPDESRPHYQYPPRIPQQLVQQFHQERLIETVFRRNWLDIQYANEQTESEDQREPSRKRMKMDIDIKTVHNVKDTNMYDNIDDETEDSDSDDSDDDGEEDTISSGGSTASDDSNQPSETPLDPPNKEKPCLQVGIASGGRSNRRLKVAARSDEVKGYLKYHRLFSLTLFELIPRFMDLSSNISRVLGDINDGWVELASEFMWQSVLERLQQMPSNRYTKPSRTPFKTIRDDFGIRTWIEECFAWGWPQSSSRSGQSTKSKNRGRNIRIRPSQISLSRIKKELELLNARPESDDYLLSKLEIEDEIAEMFLMQANQSLDEDEDENKIKDKDGDGTSSDNKENQQNVRFTTLRNQHLTRLLDLIVEERPVSDHVPFNMTTRRFCEASPIKPFISSLLMYMNSLFTANMSSDISGKPILVQIDDGSEEIEGMVSKDEFPGFLERVGLGKKNGDERIRMNGNKDKADKGKGPAV